MPLTLHSRLRRNYTVGSFGLRRICTGFYVAGEAEFLATYIHFVRDGGRDASALRLLFILLGPPAWSNLQPGVGNRGPYISYFCNGFVREGSCLN